MYKILCNCLVSCAFIGLATSACIGGDVVLEWNQIMADVLLADETIQNPGMASRTMAMTNIAMYDAINGVTATHKTFYDHAPASTGASKHAAAVQAAYRVLSGIYPGQQGLLDSHLSDSRASLPDGESTALGLAFGDVVGATVLSERSDDGFDKMVPYAPTMEVGHWQYDPLNPDQGVWGPEWGHLKTFSLPDTSSMMPPEMPSLTSQAYTDAFAEVKDLGAIDSETRTEEQTTIGLFWAYDRLGMGTPMQLYNQVLRNVAENQGNDMHENARLFALASTAVADAGIVAWDSKFKYDFWRPITGIRQADADGNPDTSPDPEWIPLGAPGGVLDDGTIIEDFTPPFPYLRFWSCLIWRCSVRESASVLRH